jgi:CheY-like chemotaxis protein
MDDEGIIRRFLYRVLTNIEYEVELTKDGNEAIEQYTKARELRQPFNAVILDLTVPGAMGGKEVINKLTEIDPDVKAIVSSGYANDPIMAEFKKYDFSAVVSKPYSIEELAEVLHNLIV